MNLLKSLSTRLIQQGITLNDCSRKEYQPIKFINNHEVVLSTLSKILIESIDVYMGIKAVNISEALLKKTMKEIISKYSDLSLQDIEYSFERFQFPEKINFSSLTINELIAPIQRYYNIKYKIKAEKIKIEREINENNERKLKSDIFYQEALKKYAESLEIKKWIGDMYQAKVILHHFKNFYTQEDREKIKKEAKIEFLRIQEKNEINSILFTEERILAEMVVKKSIELGIKI